ncbi:metallophosphoesterase [Enterovirga sp.]|uniref:metallophosphoesterase n=1 Tax=Enterovirga sp. TaxID=2026350 RepID=UPI00262E46A3|nr:metallophosphoesterase [Enterovirga sp.]MDB5592171.1 Uncharacterized protein [Enterovirga sp.]
MPKDHRPPNAKSSVCWFAPLQLLRTGKQVAIATMLGQHAPPHAIEAVTTPRVVEGAEGARASTASDGRAGLPWHDYADEPAPFWFDYLADTGDGWDATATLAYYVSRDSLPLGDGATAPVVTRRGSLMVFGGDTIYPTASLQNYEERLLLPFRTMFSPTPDEREPKDDSGPSGLNLSHRPDVFAIPGNHDWYDGLVSFTRLFCSRQGFAGWCAPQRRSYFALRLPGRWWLLGTDLQLGSDIDTEQEAFFRDLAETMPAEDRIVICHAEPHWLYERLNPDPYAYRSVQRLEERFGDRIRVSLSGDLHCYRRYATANGRQRIVSGGGGAFLHLTARLDDGPLAITPGPGAPCPEEGSGTPFESRTTYPSARTSASLALLGPLTFHLRNPPFGVATALAYVILGEALVRPTWRPDETVGLWEGMVTRLFTDPFSLFLVTAFLTGVVFFTDTESRLYRWIAGSLHGVCHLVAAALVARASAHVAHLWLEEPLWRYPAVALGTALGGYLLGPFILSLYLTVSLLVFGRHREEASSALRCPDLKNFLRFRIGPEGDLTIFPVAIDRVGRRWVPEEAPRVSGHASLRPEDASAPRLIESPIRISP